MLCVALSRGERLKLAREYHSPKLDQEELAPMLGIARSTLAKYETSQAETVPLEVLRKAAAALKIREAYFFAEDVEGPPFGYRLDENDTRLIVREELAEFLHAGEASKAAQGIMKGDKVLLRCFRGVTAGHGDDDEAAYVEEEVPRAVFAFLTGGDSEHHDVLIVRGNSLHGLIEAGWEVIVRHERSPKPDDIVVVKDPEHRTLIKVLKVDRASGREYLVSKHPDYKPIYPNRDGWEYCSVAIAIVKRNEDGSLTFIWDEGRPLRDRLNTT